MAVSVAPINVALGCDRSKFVSSGSIAAEDDLDVLRDGGCDRVLSVLIYGRDRGCCILRGLDALVRVGEKPVDEGIDVVSPFGFVVASSGLSESEGLLDGEDESPEGELG